jgi:hypothetical protein
MRFALQHWWFDNGWNGPQLLGGSLNLSVSPGAVCWAPGHIDVFAVDQATSLQHWWFDNGWNGPESWGGLVSVFDAQNPLSPTNIPNAISAVNTVGRLDVFTVGGDLTLRHWWSFKAGIRRPSTVAELVEILFGVIQDGGGATSRGPVPPWQELEVCLLVAEVAKNLVGGARGEQIQREAMRLVAQIAQKEVR